MERRVASTCWYLATKLQAVTSQRTTLLIFTTVRTSSQTCSSCFLRKTYRLPIFILFSPLFSLLPVSSFCFKAKTCFSFSFCMGDLSDIVNWWVKDFWYTVMRSQIQQTSTVIMDLCDCNYSLLDLLHFFGIYVEFMKGLTIRSGNTVLRLPSS
jgi:hypothetical protein